MKPKIVCLCGSTKFKKAYEEANKSESLKGNIVLSVGCFTHHDKLDLEKDQKQGLDDLHKKKIDMADEILVLNVKGYIGDSTKSEIKYAKEVGKTIRYLEDPKWYGDGTDEDLGDVKLDMVELEDIFSTIRKSFDSDQLKKNIIKTLNSKIKENNEKSVKIINLLLWKLTNLAIEEFKGLPSLEVENSSTWTSYFNSGEIRMISDYIVEATSFLGHKNNIWSDIGRSVSL